MCFEQHFDKQIQSMTIKQFNWFVCHCNKYEKNVLTFNFDVLFNRRFENEMSYSIDVLFSNDITNNQSIIVNENRISVWYHIKRYFKLKKKI